MSYSISMRIDAGGPEPISLDLLWDYTSNCSPMWCEAGADLADFHEQPAGECAQKLRAAIESMERDPVKYRAMNPPNGWGSYETLIPKLRELLAAFERAPKAIVRVWR